MKQLQHQFYILFNYADGHELNPEEKHPFHLFSSKNNFFKYSWKDGKIIFCQLIALIFRNSVSRCLLLHGKYDSFLLKKIKVIMVLR